MSTIKKYTLGIYHSLLLSHACWISGIYTIKKYILALYHSLLLSYVCWFGGKMEGKVRRKTLYLLWTIVVRDGKRVTINNCNIIQLTNRKYIFKAVKPLLSISYCDFTTYNANNAAIFKRN